MWNLLNQILNDFKGCFSRQASFKWFASIIIEFMLRSSSLGVTSVIRDLNLSHSSYATMIHFFHSSSWKLEVIAKKWTEIVKGFAPIYQEDGVTILVGDGVKASKGEYIFEHMFGGIGVIVGNNSKLFCIPLFINIQDGIKTIRSWINPEEQAKSHVVQMIENGFLTAKTMDKSLLLLDRYFLSVSALETLNNLNNNNCNLMQIVTKAKQSCIAYEKPEEYIGRGRPRKKGFFYKSKSDDLWKRTGS